MENKKEEFDLDKELIPQYVKNIKTNYERRKEIFESLEKAKAERERKEGYIVGGAVAIAVIVGIGIGIALLNTDFESGKKQTTQTTEIAQNSNITIYRTYQVKKDDNLYSIYEKTGIPVKDIQLQNDIKGDLIYPGESLFLVYTIDKGDLDACTERVVVGDMSLEEIASSYDTSVYTLVALNPDTIVPVNNTVTSDGIQYIETTYVINGNTILAPNYPNIIEHSKGMKR